MILLVTAAANHGLCGHCQKLARREHFDAIVAAWERDPATIPGTHGIPEPADLALALRARQLRTLHAGTARVAQVCDEFFDAAHAKWRQGGAAALSDKERHVLAVETFLGEVGNGGLAQYLGNESHAFAPWAAEAFARIGSRELAQVMRRVEALFPRAEIPDSYEACQAILAELDEGALEAIERTFLQRQAEYKSELRQKLYAYLTGKQG